MVVIGIIAIMAGLLVPMVTRARKVANITLMKSNFATIETALEYYKTDFGDYPRNPFALTDLNNTNGLNTGLNFPDGYRPLPPRTDPTLAMALIGPGPANVVNGYPNGDPDGADGPGFRTRLSLYLSTSIPAAVAAGSLTVTVSGALPTIPTVNVAPLFTIVSLGGPGSPDASVPIKSCGGSTITLIRPLMGSYPANTPCALMLPTGKPYDPYLKPDQFNIAYISVPLVSQNAPNYEKLSLPVLLDIWGGPILYFPTYNAYTNRTGPLVTAVGTLPASTMAVANPVASGPLLGSPSANSLVFKYNTKIDPIGNNTMPSIFWSGPLGSWGVTPSPDSRGVPLPPPPFTTSCDPNTPMSQGQIAAILYKLGDQNANNAIESGENLVSQLPFFMISAGPDGKFTELYSGTTGVPAIGMPGSQGTWSATITKSDDIYSFDH
jgi:type II secretory pathway pseudopilin PulG